MANDSTGTPRPGPGRRGRYPHALGHPEGAAHTGGPQHAAHALHSVAKVAPQHLVVMLGHDRDRIAPAIAELADELGRPIEIAVQDQQLGTGHAVALRPGGTARGLHRHCRGHLWRRATLDAGLIYIEPDRDDFLTQLHVVDEPLATLPLERIRPGKEALEEIMEALR